MSPKRALSGSLFLLAMLVWAWLLTLWTHELGHVIGALLTGSTVQRVVLHPLAFSRTDVHPIHNPLVVVWAGPIGGCVFGALVSILLSASRKQLVTVALLTSGLCWLVNAVYIGVGAVVPIADARAMVDFGSPRWMLAAFGLVVGIPGYLLVRKGVARLRVQLEADGRFCMETAVVSVGACALAAAGLLFFSGP